MSTVQLLQHVMNSTPQVVLAISTRDYNHIKPALKQLQSVVLA